MATSGITRKLLCDASSGLRAEFTRTIEPARSLAQETLKLECTLSDLFNQAYGFTPEDIDLMWKRAPPRMPIPAPGTRKGQGEPGHENSEG